MSRNKVTSTERIRTLNDQIRRNIGSGRAVMTIGVAALGPEVVARIIKMIAVFDDFCAANDPHEENDPHKEHDFGAVEVDGKVIFFKIDYYDTSLTCHSPKPADPSVTECVLTIMLAEEY